MNNKRKNQINLVIFTFCLFKFSPFVIVSLFNILFNTGLPLYLEPWKNLKLDNLGKKKSGI